MDARFATFAAAAAEQHHVLSAAQCDALGVCGRTRTRWARLGLLQPVGLRCYALPGTASWHQELMSGLLDLGPQAFIAGRAGAALLGLDDFRPGPVELLVPRALRNRRISGRLASTTRPVTAADVCRVDGLRCLRAERLILEAPLFDFTEAEMENAIDSAIRLRLTAESRLRERVGRDRSPGVNGTRVLLDALVDAGGESKLERRFLRILRRAGLPRPQLQVSHKDGHRIIARVDTSYGEELVIEVEGHRTHSTRQQRERDEARRTELILRGKRVIVFTYNHVMRRSEWTLDRIREALSQPETGSGRAT